MSNTPKKFKFEDLQPHVDMLCDALENRGASSSGIPHNKEVVVSANAYREILNRVRNKEITKENLLSNLTYWNFCTKEAAENNQRHRIEKIVDALDFFMMKEYNKVYDK
jgi:hypothetical protein